MHTIAPARLALRKSRPALAAVLLGSLILVGCSSNPPKEQFAVTESAVRSALSSEATRYAPVEMSEAQRKFREAERAMQSENFEEARRLAEQAEWDARVAERKARAAKAQQAAEEARRGVEELREESLRSLP